MKKLLIITGPTAVGKTALAIKIASQIKAELINADSRQVFQEIEIISGKDRHLFGSVKVWGLDLVRPDQEFSLAHWFQFTTQTCQEIWSGKKLPLIVGGTGFWLWSLFNPVASLGIVPNWKLRTKLSTYSVTKLQQILRQLDLSSWQRLNQSDQQNPRRLIRRIEIAKRIMNYELRIKNENSEFRIDQLLIVCLTAERKKLYQLIDDRVRQRIKQGAEREVRKLINCGYLLNSPVMTTIGVKEWLPYFAKTATLPQVIKAWQEHEHQLSRRQLTWLKKLSLQPSLAKHFHWLDISQPNFQAVVEKLILTWYDKSDGKN